MRTLVQPELPVRTDTPPFCIRADHPNVEWLVELLQNGGWLTSAEVLAAAQKPATEHNKRWVRALADASHGRVAGGQRGYKLVRAMTGEEFQRWRNAMNHQAEEMKRRVVEADKVFYGRVAV